MLLILGCGLVGYIVPVVEWAYFGNPNGDSSKWVSVGAALVVAGLAFRIWSIRMLGRQFTATVQLVEGHQLITAGPYAIVRHPSYLGAFTAIAGAAVLLEAPIGLLTAVVLMAIAYRLRIRVEERLLSRTFGQAYESYKDRVPALIPVLLQGNTTRARLIVGIAVLSVVTLLVAFSLYESLDNIAWLDTSEFELFPFMPSR
jgi:protein-S-isoprenylcysteine O-methyltransferase Ste14